MSSTTQSIMVLWYLFKKNRHAEALAYVVGFRTIVSDSVGLKEVKTSSSSWFLQNLRQKRYVRWRDKRLPFVGKNIL